MATNTGPSATKEVKLLTTLEKYPTIVNSADVAIITKIDLADAVEFDKERFYESIYKSRPEMKIFEVSAKKDEGIDEWIDFLIKEKNLLGGQSIN